ncbi:MAG TPA: restriction endonuclease subunit M [Porphyromonadaceae bacterium]|nr:restriction endonuclease subunit M [Porphyromonadaceae bacterium]
MNQQVDIKENDIFALSPELLDTLLKDHTLSIDGHQVNIFWATDSYADRGAGYQYGDKITVEAITGSNGNVIVPRAVKSRPQQQQRSREMAEVFTPSWICNKQNNLVDNAWFGRESIFNTEVDNPDGTHSWIVSTEPIIFPEGKTWRDYVNENRLEITCGEAPYLVSRYDTVTGEPIPVERRIGLLDRKLRVVSENTETTGEWLKAAQSAYQSIYGFEWQGDNLILAREALLYTFLDYYRAKFGKDPQLKSLQYIAYIISWNIWQMDGLKGVIPNSCIKLPKIKNESLSLFNPEDLGEPQEQTLFECPGCKNKDIHTHTGKYAIIKDWKENKILTFVSLIKQK